jgi:mannose-6-phosphate isomerase-like protein (cupin superfamily)
MAATWERGTILEQPSHIAPSGQTEIRLLPSLPSGELTHATQPAGAVSKAGRTERVTEAFFVLSGEGSIWRGAEAGEEVVPLYPNRCVLTPPDVAYQYRAADGTPLVFVVAVMPRWERGEWQEHGEPYWDDGGRARRPLRTTPSEPPWQTKDLPQRPDYLAPDGSEIRLLPECAAGGLAHCTLPADATTRAVRHRTVDEVWYGLAGSGEVWRSDGSEEVVRIEPETCLTIPAGTSFQFRADRGAPLAILIGTFPRWPGPDEAVPVAGPWQASA